MGLNVSNTHDTRKEAKRVLEELKTRSRVKGHMKVAMRQGLVYKMDRGHTDRRMWEIEGTDSLQQI